MKTRRIISKDARLKLGLKEGETLDVQKFVSSLHIVSADRLTSCRKIGYQPLM